MSAASSVSGLLRQEEPFYKHVRLIAAMPDVAMAMQSCMIAIKEGGVGFTEGGSAVPSNQEASLHVLLDAILRSILMFNACAVVIDEKMAPRVLNPGVDGVFKFEKDAGAAGSVQWIMDGQSAPNPNVSVSWFNPVGRELQMSSCVAFLSAAASQWEEISANYIASDFSQSHTSYGLVLRNAGLITSESTALRGSPTDARFAISNVVAMQAKAQMTGRAPDTSALTAKMAALADAVKTQTPPGRTVCRYTTSVTGETTSVHRAVPGTMASPMAPGFATEPASPVARNPHFLELRTNMWLLPISAAFGIPPTRLFGFRGPWDTGNLSRSSANMQVEANYRNRISNFRELVDRVFLDISNHGRTASIGSEVRWWAVPLALRNAAASQSPDNLLAPYARHLKRSGSFPRAAEPGFPDQSLADEGEWIAMLRVLAVEIQQKALSEHVILETEPILEYLKTTRGRDYDAWIRKFTNRPKSMVVDSVVPTEESSDNSASGGTPAQEPEPPVPVLYQVVWRREPGLAQMLLTMIDGSYVDKDEAMRIVLPELGFRDEDQIERLLKGAPGPKRAKREKQAEAADYSELDKLSSVPEDQRHFEGPPQEFDSNA